MYSAKVWLLSFLCLQLPKELPVFSMLSSPFLLSEANTSLPWFPPIFFSCWCLGGAALLCLHPR